MLVRNCVLAVRWIYEILEVTIYHIHGDGQGNTGSEVITNSVLLVVLLTGKNVICLSNWIPLFHPH